jgi:hypothetical protein
MRAESLKRWVACLATGVALCWHKTVHQVNERMIYETLQWGVERT